MLSFGLSAFLLLGLQETPAADTWKSDFTLSLERKDGRYVFAIEGTTDLPPETLLRARVYALEIVDDFQRGKREDEEPLVWEDDGGQPSHKSFNPVNGKFREEVYSFVRKPWSILYRARIYYVPRDQTAQIQVKVGDDDFSRHADLRIGSAADFAEELRANVQEVTEDLIAVEKLYGELCDTYDAHRKKLDLKEWEKWKGPWQARVEILDDRNKDRFSLWAVWMERQAKMRLGGMCDLLRRISSAAHEQFVEGQNHKDRIHRMITGFVDYFEEAIEVIGVHLPLNVRLVGPITEAYDKALAPLRRWIDTGTGDGSEILRHARRDGLGALLDFPPLFNNRKRAYRYVNEVGLRLTRLLELLDAAAPAEAVKKALGEHDAALAEFKKFAGLP
jgi:hypothetical protein